MSRRRRAPKPTYFYCPKCAQKKLRWDFVDDPTVKGQYGACRKIWVCDNDKAPAAGGGITKCGCEISTPGRNAEIADWVNPLDRIVSDVPQTITWIIGNDSKVHKKGLEAVFVGTHLDAVRLRDEDGVGIHIYFRMRTWDEDKDLSTLMSHACGRHITFRGRPMQQIFSNCRFTLFSKDKWQSTWNPPFFKSGNETPELLSEAKRFAAELDKEFLTYVEMMKKEREQWDREERQLQDLVRTLSGGLLGVERYDHVANKAHVRIESIASREQITAMAEALKSAGLTPAVAIVSEDDDADDD